MATRRLPILVVVLTATVMALLMVVMVGTVPEEAGAASRFKKVVKDFRNPAAIVIGPARAAANPYPSEINASGFRQGVIKDVNLIFYGFSHTLPDDVDVLLVHRGQNRTVMSDAGGGTDVNGVNVILDDEAVPVLPDIDPISTNAWKPTNYTVAAGDTFPAPAPNPPNAQAALSGFDGANPNGTWALYVSDDDDGDSGQFAGGWLIQITARVRR